MAVCVYTRADIESIVERLMNRSNSPMFNERPELQRDIKSICMVANTLMAHAPIESITIVCQRHDKS
jgi:hypothetical protein